MSDAPPPSGSPWSAPAVELSRIDLNLLVALDALLQEQSVRRAAERVGLTPSAMSHALARLRDLLGDPILTRAGRRMVPTERALALTGPLHAQLRALEALLAPPAELDPSTLERAFRVMATDHVVTLLQPGVERLLAAEAPAVALFVEPLTPVTMERLRDGRLDLAIGVFPEAPPEMRTRRLFEDRFVVVLREGHPALEAPLDLGAYLALDHLLVAPRGTPRGLVDRVLEEQDRSRRVARTVPHFLAAVHLLPGTDFALTLSARLAAALGPGLGLALRPVPLSLGSYALHALWHPRRDADPAHEWLRGVWLRAAEALPAPPEPPVS